MAYEAVVIAIPAYFALQAWVLFAWRGGWRWSAVLPIVILAGLIVQAVLAYRQGSNLWPILVILFPILGFGYLALIAFFRTVVRWTSGT